MMTYVALLRAINVAGHNKVSMVDLRSLFSELGFSSVRSLLQSGNLVFESDPQAADGLERIIEEGAKSRLGLETEVFVRTAREWAAILDGNPFADEAKRDPSHLVIMFLTGAPDRKNVTALEEAIVGHEVIRAIGRHLYVVYPDGIGRSRLTNALIERKLGTNGTARNWNTVVKIVSLATQLPF